MPDRRISSEQKTAALSGSQHSSRINESLRVARIPSTSQFGSTLRPSASRGSIRMIPADGFVAPSGYAATKTKSAASSIKANILRPVM